MSPETQPTTHSFTDRHALAVALAERVADCLSQAIAERGHALLAVSGGSTPALFFDCLARAELDWSKVQVTLVDERWVAESDERSNARLVRARLLQHAAAAALLVPLYSPESTPEAGQPIVARRIEALPLPFDVVILGMGLDGHTASFFPGGDRLDEALDPATDEAVLPMRAPGAGEPRITLSLATLLKTRALFVHIEGKAKRRVLTDAQLGLGPGASYPIRAVLDQTAVPVAVYWCA
jgi:6-phosphogluconolactonase